MAWSLGRSTTTGAPLAQAHRKGVPPGRNQLVSCLVDSLAVAGDRFEDLFGGFGPDVGAWVLVPVLDPGADVNVESADAGVRAAAQQLGGQLSEPALDEVDPAAGGRGEVQDEARVAGEPAFDLR